MQNDCREIMDKIDNKEITSVPQLLITLDLFGVAYKDFFSQFLVRSMLFENEYELFKDSLKNYDVFDSCMTESNINTLIDNSGNRYNNKDYVKILLDMDLRRPIILLKYFLKRECVNEYTFKDEYFRLFEHILKRTKLRSEKIKELKNIYEKLKVKYNDTLNLCRLYR